jgi:hypothetical protein
MRLINTHDLTVFGQGSEWLWTMLQFVVVVVTLAAIYRQVRLQNGVYALQQIEMLQGSKRLALARLETLLHLRENGRADLDPVRMQMSVVANFFENLSDLDEEGHLRLNEIRNTWGASLQAWWLFIGRTITDDRTTTGDPRRYTGFERLARLFRAEDERLGIDQGFHDSNFRAMLDHALRASAQNVRLWHQVESSEEPSAVASVLTGR